MVQHVCSVRIFVSGKKWSKTDLIPPWPIHLRPFNFSSR